VNTECYKHILHRRWD